ncbi:MAG: DUF169 domain-containing protein [Deltaproteobacteria bacterium]|nr:DUF169 domain-containing protein [Deltaproteobacteria bacterium]MBW1983351.1 DUF169 domain-containing protein [Deltaproteobacteria bacterium]
MVEELGNYKKIGEKIEKYIRPSTFPLAVKLIKSNADIEQYYKRPEKDLKLQNFICQNFKMSRSYGWTIAVTEEDTNCKLARAVYGWDQINEETAEWMNLFSIGLYAKDKATAEKMSGHMYFLNNEYMGLVISPLTRTKVVPDIVLIYCLPAQAMRLIQSYLYVEGGVLEFTSAGKVGSCHEGVAKTLLTQKPQLVVLGNGDRIWGGAQDSEVMFSCPRSKLDALVEGLEATHTAGLRYPIPSYMNYSPGFQEDFEKAAVKRAGGTIAKQ